MNGVAANPTGNVYSTEVERGTGGANLHGATNCVPTSCVGGGGGKPVSTMNYHPRGFLGT